MGTIAKVREAAENSRRIRRTMAIWDMVFAGGAFVGMITFLIYFAVMMDKINEAILKG